MREVRETCEMSAIGEVSGVKSERDEGRAGSRAAGMKIQPAGRPPYRPVVATKSAPSPVIASRASSGVM